MQRRSCRPYNSTEKARRSIVVVIVLSPEARAHRAGHLLQPTQFGRCIRGCATSAVEHHDPREILVADAALVLVTHAARLAQNFPAANVASELTRRPAAHSL